MTNFRCHLIIHPFDELTALCGSYHSYQVGLQTVRGCFVTVCNKEPCDISLQNTPSPGLYLIRHNNDVSRVSWKGKTDGK